MQIKLTAALLKRPGNFLQRHKDTQTQNFFKSYQRTRMPSSKHL